MAEFSDNPQQPESPPESKTSPPTVDAIFQAGLKALSAKDYPTARRLLEQVHQKAPRAYRLKAAMGLVRVEAAQGNRQAAINLCQSLAQPHQPGSVQKWAHRTLSQLQTLNPPTSEVDRSGFVPFTSPQPSRQRPADTVADSVNQPPLSGSSDTAVSSGFSPQRGPETPSSAWSPQSGPEPPYPTVPSSEQATAGSVSTEAADSQPPSSLFHYQTLNQGMSDEEEALPSTRHAPAEVSLSETTQVTTKPQRLQRPCQVPKGRPLKLWGVTLLTVFALIAILRLILHSLMRGTNAILDWIDWPIRLSQIAAFQEDYTWPIVISLLIVTLASPWLLDHLLQHTEGQQVWSTRQLKQHSPEALRLLRRVCQERGWQMPALRLLPSTSPLAFSYGWHPANVRMVISQGVLDLLDEEALATLYAYQLGHVLWWDLPVLTAIGTLLWLLHQAYWRLAGLGNRQQRGWLQIPLGVGASFCYCCFWIVRKVGLWLTRVSSEWCDLSATEMTGNPMAWRHSLGRLTTAIAADISQQAMTPPLLESLDLLLPLSHQTVLFPGSVLNQHETSTLKLDSLLAWDSLNPYRHWLIWNNPQALLGERLVRLDRFGDWLGLQTEDLSAPATTTISLKDQADIEASQYLPNLLLQGGVVSGTLLGLAIAMVLWFLGGLFEAANWNRLSWLYQDDSVLSGFVLLGFGTGMLLRVNRLFPDITPRSTSRQPDFATLQRNTPALPIDSQPVQISGQLQGRPGLANWLGQDLLVQTPQGSLKVIAISGLSLLALVAGQAKHPVQALGHPVRMTGWFRRGATCWVDIETIQTTSKSRSTITSQIPLWTTAVGLTACLVGVYILFRGI